ncbi:HD family phosphohydrolase, partial [Thermodesulfobacteriota bacterium]
VANKEILLQESAKGIALRGIESGSEREVRDLNRLHSLAQAKATVRVLGEEQLNALDSGTRNLVIELTQALIHPNVTQNRSETEKRKKAAASQIKPVLFQIKSGEMLLREGERVTAMHIVKLGALQSHIRDEQVLSKSIGIGSLLIAFLFTFYWLHFNVTDRNLKNQNKNLLFLCITLFFSFVLAKISVAISASTSPHTLYGPSPSSVFFGTPLAAGAMVTSLFLGLGIAFPFATVMTFCAAVIFETPFETWAYFLLNSLLGAYWVRDCRERRVFVRAGLKLGLFNMALVVMIHLYRSSHFDVSLLPDFIYAFMGGLGAGILTAGLAPLIEVAFDYTTDITLLELANLDRPLLRRLMIEAPGTYHHCVVVGSMVEAAASEIMANPLLAKVCAYYHDIGKIKKPLYFIENQMSSKNPHDKLAPSMSSLILISHVRNGVEIATQYKLGTAITDTIQQHHGTSLISYFYEKARQLKKDDSVNEGDFRYVGPKPQTKEAGLVMLADVVEAASRTLENPTPARRRK